MTIIELNSVHATSRAEPPINKTLSSSLDSSPLHNTQLITNQLLLRHFYKNTMMILSLTDLLTDYAGGDDEGVDLNSPDSQGWVGSAWQKFQLCGLKRTKGSGYVVTGVTY